MSIIHLLVIQNLKYGYEYNPFIGDPESEVAPGTDFTALPDEWVCPECSEEKANFIKA